MYWHPEHRLLYLAGPRTASRSTGEALVEQAGFVEVGGHHDTAPGPALARSIATCVRYHPDALVSWWHFRRRPIPFGREFVELLMTNHAHLFPDRRRLWALHLNESTNAAASLFVFRYEGGPEAHVNEWLAESGLDPVALPTTPPKHRLDWKAFMDDETARWLDETFRDEMQAFGYAPVCKALRIPPKATRRGRGV
jgi:hypothetical protein